MTLIKLITAEGALIEVEQDIIEQSGTIRNILTDIGLTDKPIPLPNVSGPILTKIIEYCMHHRHDTSRRRQPPSQPALDTESDCRESAIEEAIAKMDDFDHEFCRIDQGTLFDLLLAANFLDIQPLLDLTGYTVANMMKGKTVQEIRDTFHVRSDFTPEEEEQVMKENAWCEN